MNLKKRYMGGLNGWLIASLLAVLSLEACAEKESHADLIIFKNPQCACCDKWASHVREAGYSIEIRKSRDMKAIKNKFGVESSLQSCHTAVHRKTGLVFEGHVPVNHMSSFLASPVEGAIGLSVPGMPIGSPGMEMGDRKEPYEVLLLLSEGEPIVYATETATEQ